MCSAVLCGQNVSSLGSTPVKRFRLWAGGLLECTSYLFSFSSIVLSVVYHFQRLCVCNVCVFVRES